jgi:hypothetical protein
LSSTSSARELRRLNDPPKGQLLRSNRFADGDARQSGALALDRPVELGERLLRFCLSRRLLPDSSQPDLMSARDHG